MLYFFVDFFLYLKWLKLYQTLNRYTHHWVYTFLIVSTQHYHLSYWHVKVFGLNFDLLKDIVNHLRRHWCWESWVIDIHSSNKPYLKSILEVYTYYFTKNIHKAIVLTTRDNLRNTSDNNKRKCSLITRKCSLITREKSSLVVVLTCFGDCLLLLAQQPCACV